MVLSKQKGMKIRFFFPLLFFFPPGDVNINVPFRMELTFSVCLVGQNLFHTTLCFDFLSVTLLQLST